MADCFKWQETKFTWKIYYFNICSQLLEKSLSSAAFSLDSFGYTEVKLLIFFRRNVNSQLLASLYLFECKSERETIEGKELNINLKIFVGDEDKNPIHTVANVEKADKFKFWDITCLNLSKIFKEDSISQVHLTIVLNISPLRNEVTTNELWVCNSEDAEVLSSDFSRALEGPKHSDFILKGNDDTYFSVHKPILILRYPKLASALRLRKSATKEHVLCKDKMTLKYLLQYLYSGKADVENVPHEMHGILDENKLFHLQCLLYPVPESTKAETKIKVRNVGFTWNIINFINRSKKGILSSYFVDDFLKWTKLKITCYFHLNEKNEEWLTFSINRIFTETPVYVACKIEILSSMEYIRQYEHIFQKESEWILPPYIPTKFLIDNKDTFLTSDALTIRFLIQISDGESTNEVICTHSPKMIVNEHGLPATNLCALQRDLRKLYKNPILCDVTVHVGDAIFRAHKIMLSSRSSVFSKMLEHEAFHDQSGKIVIKDFKPAVVQAMLSYMYCGEVDNVPEDLTFVMDLYSITDKYKISKLKAKCVTYFKKELDADNVGKVLVLADAHKDSQLKTYVKNFVCSNADEVLLSKAWKQIMRERSDLAADMLRSALSFIVDENSDK